jgi:hypothetical protein
MYPNLVTGYVVFSLTRQPKPDCRKTEQVKLKPHTSTLSPDEAEKLMAESEVISAFFSSEYNR